MVARYLNNDKKTESQIRETDTGYKVRQTMNHIIHIIMRPDRDKSLN